MSKSYKKKKKRSTQQKITLPPLAQGNENPALSVSPDPPIPSDAPTASSQIPAPLTTHKDDSKSEEHENGNESPRVSLETKRTLLRKLKRRPERKHLVEANILKAFNTDPALQNVASVLVRAQLATFIRQKLRSRNSKNTLIRANILKKPSSSNLLQSGGPKKVNFKEIPDGFPLKRNDMRPRSRSIPNLHRHASLLRANDGMMEYSNKFDDTADDDKPMSISDLEEFLSKRPSLDDLVRANMVKMDVMTWTHVNPEPSPPTTNKSKSGSSKQTILANKFHHKTRPDPCNCHSMAMIDESIFLVGGFGLTNQLSASINLWTFNLRSKEWSRPLVGGIVPTQRYSHSLVTIDKCLLMFGGFGTGGGPSGTWTNDLHALDTHHFHNNQSGSSLLSSNLIHPQNSVSHHHHSHHTYIPSLSPYNSMKARTNPWLLWYQPETTGDAPSPRAAHAACVVGKRMWIFGGNHDTKLYNDLYCLDTLSMKWWQPVPQGRPPCPRAGHSMTAIGKFLYVFGGSDGKGALNDLFIFDTEKYIWTQPKMNGTPPSVRAGHTAVSIRGGTELLIFAGGYHQKILNDLHLLDTRTFTWTRPSDTGALPCARAGHAAVAMPSSSSISLGKSKTNGRSSKKGKTSSVNDKKVHSEKISNGLVYFFGGGDVDRELFNDLYILDTGGFYDSSDMSSAAAAAALSSVRMNLRGDRKMDGDGKTGDEPDNDDSERSDSSDIHSFDEEKSAVLRKKGGKGGTHAKDKRKKRRKRRKRRKKKRDSSEPSEHLFGPTGKGVDKSMMHSTKFRINESESSSDDISSSGSEDDTDLTELCANELTHVSKTVHMTINHFRSEIDKKITTFRLKESSYLSILRSIDAERHKLVSDISHQMNDLESHVSGILNDFHSLLVTRSLKKRVERAVLAVEQNQRKERDALQIQAQAKAKALLQAQVRAQAVQRGLIEAQVRMDAAMRGFRMTNGTNPLNIPTTANPTISAGSPNGGPVRMGPAMLAGAAPPPPSNPATNNGQPGPLTNEQIWGQISSNLAPRTSTTGAGVPPPQRPQRAGNPPPPSARQRGGGGGHPNRRASAGPLHMHHPRQTGGIWPSFRPANSFASIVGNAGARTLPAHGQLFDGHVVGHHLMGHRPAGGPGPTGPGPAPPPPPTQAVVVQPSQASSQNQASSPPLRQSRARSGSDPMILGHQGPPIHHRQTYRQTSANGTAATTTATTTTTTTATAGAAVTVGTSGASSPPNVQGSTGARRRRGGNQNNKNVKRDHSSNGHTRRKRRQRGRKKGGNQANKQNTPKKPGMAPVSST